MFIQIPDFKWLMLGGGGGGTFRKNTLKMLLVYFYKLNYFLIINHNLECSLKPPNYRLWCFLFRVFSFSLLLSHSCLNSGSWSGLPDVFYKMSYPWMSNSMKCLYISIMCPVHEMSYLWISYSMKYPIEMSCIWNSFYENSYLWNILSMKCLPWKVLAMNFLFYEISYLWNVL